MSEWFTQAEIDKANAEYHPCDCGVHICGVIEDEDGERPLTIANFPTSSAAEARLLFDRLRKFEAAKDEPHDCIVDLNIDGDNLHIEDFAISRQMVEHLRREYWTE